MEHDIGYMQVQMRLYKNDELYEEFAFNARNKALAELVGFRRTRFYFCVIDELNKSSCLIFQFQEYEVKIYSLGMSSSKWIPALALARLE